MPKVKVYNAQGNQTGEKEVSAEVFGVAVKPTLVHEVVVGLRSNARGPWAHTKTKGEVRGGGKKPWKQKGTGRARQGSIRSPQWIGGGIVFGPRNERNYSKKINRKVKRLALVMSLSDKVANDRLMLVESFGVNGKTKEIVSFLGKFPVKGKVVLVMPTREAAVVRAVRNLEQVRVSGAGNLSLLDILAAEAVFATPEAVSQLETRYGGNKNA
ncbi:50S ribosomal protein L4 [Candidatus Uhrbacteria bacterium]|nr:50S ribosomal protein L4 [Candidatus Uhrbacteria bacterium]